MTDSTERTNRPPRTVAEFDERYPTATAIVNGVLHDLLPYRNALAEGEALRERKRLLAERARQKATRPEDI